MVSPYRNIVRQINEAYEEFGILISQETRNLDELNLTVQQEYILSYINKHEQITANEIAADFRITRSAVSQILSKLEMKDMIRRFQNPANRREYYLQLGPEGNKYIEHLSELDQQLIDKYYSKIPLEELIQMTATMERINAIIREEKSKTKSDED